MTFSDTQFTSPFQQTFGAHTPEQSPPKQDGRVLQALGLSTRLFVIQLSVRGVKDLAQFSFVTDNYRRNGFLTSVKAEDFVEAGSIIGQIRPDFVSLSTKESWTEQSFAALLDTAKRFHVHMITDAEATSAASERTSWSDSNALFHAGGWKQMHDNP